MGFYATDKRIRWYFGDASDAVAPAEYRLMCKRPLIEYHPFGAVAQQLGAQSLHLLDQTHSITGYEIFSQDVYKPSFTRQGDFLVTSVPGSAIGVLTADCLPIIIIDDVQRALAVVHAGWKGAVAGIVPQALMMLANRFNSRMEHCYVLFGPSARACCYQVDASFAEALTHHPAHQFITSSREQLFFDLPGFVYNQLIDYGIPAASIDTSLNLCTIHSVNYCSYRRDGTRAGRQITCAVLI